LATARESLFDEMMALAAGPAGGDADDLVRRMMLRYRVQTKPGVHIADGTTARDALGDRLLDLWRKRPGDLSEKVGSTIDEFRMQAKGAGGAAPKEPKAAKPARPTTAAPSPSPSTPPRAARADAPPPMPRTDPAIEAARRRIAEPVDGGPRRRGKTRSECPKCKSMGVVLARSYAGDDYYSCIYCGWQAYKPADDSDPTASLATRLLGHTGGAES
jgi:hypothetical protein